MGAAEQQKFSQYPYQYGDGLRGAALAQTRNGKDELITPIAFWELDAATGLYMPPGMSSNPRKPRVEATLTGSDVQIEVTQLLNAEPLSAGASISGEFDLQTYGELVVWVAIDRQYSLQFYRQLTSGGANLPIAVTIADNASPPALGRTHAYDITQYLPTHTGRLLVTNRNTTETATVSLWIGRVKRL